VSNKFGPVVEADVDRVDASLQRDPVEHRNDVVGVD